MRYSPREELLHTTTHGLGLALASVGSIVLLVRAVGRVDLWSIAGVVVFAATLCAAYLASTLYHAADSASSSKAALRVFDHIAIYLLIAGTYTPFALIPLRGIFGYSLLGLIWGLAAVGIAFRLRLRQFPAAPLGLYLLMGWMALVALQPLAESLDLTAVILFVLGGLAYFVGVAFFLWRALPFNHTVWHLWVMLGSGLHYFAVLHSAVR
jgi:hemolysin III